MIHWHSDQGYNLLVSPLREYEMVMLRSEDPEFSFPSGRCELMLGGHQERLQVRSVPCLSEQKKLILPSNTAATPQLSSFPGPAPGRSSPRLENARPA
jgi:hypothetical protein